MSQVARGRIGELVLPMEIVEIESETLEDYKIGDVAAVPIPLVIVAIELLVVLSSPVWMDVVEEKVEVVVVVHPVVKI